MARRHYIFLDATLESQAPFFAQSPIFQPWLRSYNNIPEALEIISQITLPNSIEIYMPRDNILDDGLPPNPNAQTRTLIETVCDLRTVDHVSIFSPAINTDLEQQIRNIIPERRLIKTVISVINLHSYMCLEGVTHFQNEIAHCMSTKEFHLIENFEQNIKDLMEYLKQIIKDRKKVLETMEEEYSNKPGEEPL